MQLKKLILKRMENKWKYTNYIWTVWDVIIVVASHEVKK